MPKRFARCKSSTATLARRNSEYGERIAHQSATINVLKAMSASPGDARPVFDLIAERTRTFCAADKVAVALLEGDTLRLRAHTRYDAAFDEEYERLFPRPLDATSVLGRTIAARQVIQSPDLHDDAVHVSTQMRMKDIRSVAGVPIMLAGQPVGAISLARRTPGAVLGHADRVTADLRRAGRHRHRQRPNVPRAASADGSAGTTQQRIRRADRTPVGDDRRA